MAGHPFHHPDAAQFMKDPEAVKKLLGSAEARRIIAMLSRQGDLAGAAQQAKAGSTGQLMHMLGRLQQDPEGAKALKDLEGKLGK